MQFCRSPAEQFHVFEIRADELRGDRRDWRMLQTIDERHRPEQILHPLDVTARPRRRAIEVLAELVQRMPPRITFIRHKALQDADSCRLASFRSIFNDAGDRWSMRKRSPLGQEISDFDVRIDSFLSFAKELQD